MNPLIVETAQRLIRDAEQLLNGGAAHDDATMRSECPDLLGFGFHDCDNAQRLIAARGEDMRFCHAFRKWMLWDGRRWTTDLTDQARRIAQNVMIEFLHQAVERRNEPAQKFVRESLDSKRLSAMLLEAEPRLFVIPEELDTQPHLLNCLNGTLDLKTGTLRPHARADLITKIVHHNYVPGAECPAFTRFLLRIMGDTPDASEAEQERADRLVGYLQKAFGYALTGSTIEKIVFLLHGSGSNGKTTLLATFFEILREYAALLHIDTLMVKQENNNSQADLADLRGARFVMTSETEEGQRLAEGRLKRITQGMGRIKAVRKYENPFEFPETHKLWMDCNHRPAVRGTDNAIWNRLRPIPFKVIIPPEEIDKELLAKLLEEAEGILAWSVAGAIQWYLKGLGDPPEVQEESQKWRKDMDQIGRFIEERCIQGPVVDSAKARQLYTAYKVWAESGGEHAMAERDFGPKLVDRGFKKEHTKTGTVYHGLELKESSDGG